MRVKDGPGVLERGCWQGGSRDQRAILTLFLVVLEDDKFRGKTAVLPASSQRLLFEGLGWVTRPPRPPRGEQNVRRGVSSMKERKDQMSVDNSQAQGICMSSGGALEGQQCFCVNACVRVSAHMHTRVCTRVCTHVHPHTCICAYLRVCICGCVCVCACVHVCTCMWVRGRQTSH